MKLQNYREDEDQVFLILCLAVCSSAYCHAVSFRGERRKEEKEEAEALVQHLHGPHKVEDTQAHVI